MCRKLSIFTTEHLLIHLKRYRLSRLYCVRNFSSQSGFEILRWLHHNKLIYDGGSQDFKVLYIGILEQLSKDLKNDYPKVKGFSVRNCQFMIQFYNEYNQELTNTKQPVSYLTDVKIMLPVKQLSWSHNVILMQKVKDLKARYWYMIQCLKNGWGRNFLVEAINQEYYNIHGALNRFSTG